MADNSVSAIPSADTLDPGEAHRDTMAERSRAASLRVRDIGELPAVVNPRRRARAAKDFLYFCKTYFPEIFFLAWSRDHKTVARKIETVVREGGRFALAMPRHSGKTAMTLCAVLWAVLYGYRQYVAIIAANEGKAEELLRAAKNSLADNELLAADFPEVCYPIARLEGITQRRLVYHGDGLRMEFTARRLVLPNIPAAPASSAILTFAGITGSLRGMVFMRPDGRMVRPSLVILDDPQTDESARSPQQCADRERIVKNAILGLAGPGVELSVLMPCTVIAPSDLADRFLDRKQNPEWQAERMKLVYSFPTDEKLWTRYTEIRRQELLDGGDGRQATAFYRKNRRAMDAGAEIAWPAMFRPKELSGVQYAMDLLAEDRRMFFAEYQNDPLPENGDTLNQLSAVAVAAKCNGLPRGAVPQECRTIVAGIDVHDRLLYWLVLALADGFRGAVVDYGTWPQQPTPYFSLTNCPHPLEAAYPGCVRDAYIAAGLRDCTAAVLGRTYAREDGAPLRVEKLLVDAHWGEQTEQVKTFCRRHADYNRVVLPSFGVGVKPGDILRVGRKPGGRFGPGWGIPPAEKGMLHVTFDADFGKSQVAQRLSVPLGTPGGFDLFGRDPRQHSLLSEHCTAERSVQVTRGEARKESWELLPNRDNHWWDNLVQCLVAGMLAGVALPGSEPTRSRRGRTPSSDGRLLTMAELSAAAKTRKARA